MELSACSQDGSGVSLYYVICEGFDEDSCSTYLKIAYQVDKLACFDLY